MAGFALDSRGASPYRAFATPPDLDNVMPSPLPTEAEEATRGPSSISCPTAAWTPTCGSRRAIGTLCSPAGEGARTAASTASRASPGQPRRPAAERQRVGWGRRRRAAPQRAPAGPQGGVRPLPSPYRLVVRGAGGMVLSDVAMAMRTFVVDRDGPPPVVLQGTAPILPSTARSVEIVRDGAVVARRDRSASAPTARFVTRGEAPGSAADRSLRSAGRPPTPIATRSTSTSSGRRAVAGRGPGGRSSSGPMAAPSACRASTSPDPTTRSCACGSTTGSTRPSSSRRAFGTVHHRPAVSIETPRPGARVRRDASLLLTARAIDERRAPIRADRIRWFNGSRQIARGNGVVVRGLTPGPKSLRAEATNNAGAQGVGDRARERCGGRPGLHGAARPGADRRAGAVRAVARGDVAGRATRRAQRPPRRSRAHARDAADGHGPDHDRTRRAAPAPDRERGRPVADRDRGRRPSLAD